MKRKGAVELIYTFFLLSLSALIVLGFLNFYRNTLKLNAYSEKITIENNEINTINIEIGESIQKRTYKDFNNSLDFKIETKKLTNNLSDFYYKTLKKDYSFIEIKPIPANTDVEYIKTKKINYFLFSPSGDMITVSSEKGGSDYIIGEKDGGYLFGIDDTHNAKIHFSSSVNNNVYIFSYPKNTKHDIYVSKITKNDETYYTIFIENTNEIIQAYSFLKK